MASKLQDNSERVLPWQVTMDQVIYASLSHTHYWYELGMLKVLTTHDYNFLRATDKPVRSVYFEEKSEPSEHPLVRGGECQNV